MPFQQLLNNLQSHLDGLLENYLTVAGATQPRGIGTFSAASRTLGTKATEASGLVSEMHEKWAEVTDILKQMHAAQGRLSTTASEGDRILAEVEKARRTTEENEQKAAAAATQIEAVRQQAATLQAQVQEYTQQFESFQKQLDNRSEALAAGNAELERLRMGLGDKDKEVSELIGKATEMLGGATVAGLSAAYKSQMDKVDGQLKNARYFYYFSIVLLILSVLVALNVFSPFDVGLSPLPTFSDSTPTGSIAVQVLAGLGSRGLLILPALLLAGFAAHRHSALFRLREEYSHKYSMAASVQGFKIQAPLFQEPIAAAVFTELLHNPAATMDKLQSANRNGFVDKLIMPRVEEALKRATNLQGGA